MPQTSARLQCGGDASVGVTDWTPGFVRSFLEKKTTEQSVLLDRIPAVPDFQSAWLLLLLLFFVAPRSNFWLRTVPPELVEAFATAHDVGLWQCLCAMHVNGDMVSASDSEPSTEHGRSGFGERRSRQAGDDPRQVFPGLGHDQPHSWFPARHASHTSPNMGGSISHQGAQTRHLCLPGWSIIVGGRESNVAFGRPTGCVSIHMRADVETRPFRPQPFRVLLLRRLRLTISLAAKACRCGRPMTCLGCPGRAAALAPGCLNTTDSRRLEVVADGLPLFGWSSTCNRHHVGQLCVEMGVRDVTPHPETELMR